MNISKKISYLVALTVLVCVGLVSAGSAQDRDRIVRTVSSQPINQPPAASPIPTDRSKPSSPLSNTSSSRPILTNQIVVAEKPLVKKIVSSTAVKGTAVSTARMAYSSTISYNIFKGIQSRLGIPYLYGSTGPNRYDCSGFVWSVFNDAGIKFTRSSARTLWAASEPVYGSDQFKFGTLVFLNGLGHMGIVADENGFYHASSSKGITYSPFKGYWQSRIVGFRRLPMMTQEISPDLAQ